MPCLRLARHKFTYCVDAANLLAGKLPFTWYNSKFTAASTFDNLNMTDGPGRTYKYLKDPSMALPAVPNAPS